MKKNLLKLIITISILIIIPYSCITALGNIDWTPECEKALQAHPEFLNIEKEWVDKLGMHYVINLTGNRVLEFAEIDSRNGGGKYAQLRRINEFEVRGTVKYPKDSNIENHWKDCYGHNARFSDLTKGMGIKIETMIDVINHYDEVLAFIKKIANEQYSSGDYAYHVDTEDRKATIWIAYVNGYPEGLWHGVKDDEIPFNEDWGEWWCVSEYGENWREKLNTDLPKIRKSLGLEN